MDAMDIQHGNQYDSPKLPAVERPAELKFGSKSEYACGVMLEKYVPNFQLEMGKTMQVPIGYSKRCDFLVNGVFFEWHPINLQNDFFNRDAYNELIKNLRFCKSHVATEIVDSLKREFYERYCNYREFFIKQTHGNAELIVCSSFEGFYKRVLKRFGQEVPPMFDAEQQFKKFSR